MSHLLRTGTHLTKLPNGHLALDIDGYGCDEDDADLNATYALAGYTDGDLTACASCLNSGAAGWNGVFTREDAPEQSCQYTVQAGAARSISGKVLTQGYITTVYWYQPNCWWLLRIECQGSGPGTDVWLGTKSFGNTPAGIYTEALLGTRCDPSANLTLV